MKTKSIFSIAFIALMMAISNQATANTKKRLIKDKSESDSVAVFALSNKVLQAIKNADIEKLSSFVHPTQGLRFSPYGYIDVKNDQHFSSKKLVETAKADKTIRWGHQDAKDDEYIYLSVKKYVSTWVQDFSKAPQKAFNRIIETSSKNNIKEVYPTAVFVEYHFPGTEKFDDHDWRSLRLVFVNDASGKPCLVSIITDMWTM